MSPRTAACARALLLSLAFLCAAPAPASAQPPDAKAAQEQFRNGRNAFKAGDYKRAYDLFRKSHELYPATGTLLNLALCEIKLGMLIDAQRHLNEVIPQLKARDARLAVARKELKALEPRIPHLRVQLAPDAPPDTEVSLDGAPLAPSLLDSEMPADPGARVVEVKAPGRTIKKYDVTLEEGKTASLTVAPGAAETVETPGEPPPDEATTKGDLNIKRIAGFAAGGLGVAGIGVGVVTGLLALGKKSDLEDMCPRPEQCTAAGVDLADSGTTLSVISTVGFVVGVAGLGAGAYLILTSDDEPKPEDATAQPRRLRGPTVIAAPAVLPGGGGLTVRGAF